MLQRLARLLLPGCACVLVLAGCSAGEKPRSNAGPTRPAASSGAPSEPITSPTPTPTATASVDPPTPPAGTGSRRTAEAFATYVVHAWAYAVGSNDPRPLVEVSVGKGKCGGCRPLVRTLAERRREGWSVQPFQLAPERVRMSRADGGVVARVRVDIPATRSYFSDGTFRNESPAHDDVEFTVRMRPSGKRYQLIAFSLS